MLHGVPQFGMLMIPFYDRTDYLANRNMKITVSDPQPWKVHIPINSKILSFCPSSISLSLPQNI